MSSRLPTRGRRGPDPYPTLSRRGFLRGTAGLLAAGALLQMPIPTASAVQVRLPRSLNPNLDVPGADPVVAKVLPDGVEVRAYPKADSPIRRTAEAGDLLRVVGQAPGIDDDPHTWWATTEGFLQPLEALGPAEDPVAESWTLPEADLASQGWWGEVTSQANVRSEPRTDAPIVGTLEPGQHVKVLAEEQGSAVGSSPIWYRIDGGRYAGGRVHGALITRMDPPSPNTTRPDQLPDATSWLTIDRNARTLTFVRDGNPEFVTYVAIGKAAVETPAGVYATIHKLRADDMSSARNPGAERSYHLPSVPHIQYFHEDGYALHGTYWHDRFGSEESQGCVNLTMTDGAHLFNLTEPKLQDGQDSLWSTDFATPVLIV